MKQIFTIPDGRTSFWQWDSGQTLIVADDSCNEVHFANAESEMAPVCKVREQDGMRVVDVPNILLQKDIPIKVYNYEQLGDCRATIHCEIFPVNSRKKPADYIYTKTEVWTAEKAVAEALEAAKESGDFKGDKGDKGDAGVINFVVVAELPEVGSGDSIYLMPTADSPEGNLFDEYIYVDGKWEKIGSAAVQVDLSEYVKNTDYATQTVAGVVKAGEGLQMLSGKLCVFPAKTSEISERSSGYRPIVPTNLDYAIKAGMTTNTEEWTDEDKTAARTLIGAVGAYEPTTKNTIWVYTVQCYADGTVVQTQRRASASIMADVIPITGAGGALRVGTPTADEHAATKAYVDGRITANDDGTLTILLADGSKYKVNATKEE